MSFLSATDSSTADPLIKGTEGTIEIMNVYFSLQSNYIKQNKEGLHINHNDGDKRVC